RRTMHTDRTPYTARPSSTAGHQSTGLLFPIDIAGSLLDIGVRIAIGSKALSLDNMGEGRVNATRKPCQRRYAVRLVDSGLREQVSFRETFRHVGQDGDVLREDPAIDGECRHFSMRIDLQVRSALMFTIRKIHQSSLVGPANLFENYMR